VVLLDIQKYFYKTKICSKNQTNTKYYIRYRFTSQHSYSAAALLRNAALNVINAFVETEHCNGYDMSAYWSDI